MRYRRSFRERVRDFWELRRGNWAKSFAASAPPPDFPEPPPEESALVPNGPPRRPRPSSAVALAPPEGEEHDVVAHGREAAYPSPSRGKWWRISSLIPSGS